MGMNICVIGLGSMGKRRIRDLSAIGIDKIVGVDTNPERCMEANRIFGIEVFSDAREAISCIDCNAVVISTSPEAHPVYGRFAADAGIPFFMEANVTQEGLPELVTVCKNQGILAAPSCTMRFHPSVQLLKKVIEQISPQEVASFSYVCGQYLPDWHPYEDYRRFYVANKDTGACREIVPFELIWLTWIFGQVTDVFAVKAKRTRLDVNIDDIYLLTMIFSTGVIGSLEVNIISRIPERHFRAIGEGYHIIWNWDDQKVKVYDGTEKSWKVYPETPGFKKYNLELMYFDEMKAFIQAVKGEKKYGYELEEELKTLQILYRAERMAEEFIKKA